jgi:hypothetical protein
LNENTPNLAIIDKIKYVVANFCEKIGHPNIASYIKETIAPNTVTKINKIEQVIGESLTIGKSIPPIIRTPTTKTEQLPLPNNNQKSNARTR